MTGLPHDDECEMDTTVVRPVTGSADPAVIGPWGALSFRRETCKCRHRRTQRSREIEEQPLHLPWLRGKGSRVAAGP